MVFKKIAVAACFASALTMVAAPAHAAAYLIGGKWYFFSLDFESTLARVTGKDIKTLTRVDAVVKITKSETICLNPTGKFVNPGQGPVEKAYGSSENLTDENLVKSDRLKNTFKTTTVVDLKVINPCKQPDGNSTTQWNPVFWQNYNCKGKPATQTDGDTCYTRLAAFDGNSELRLLNADGTFYGDPLDVADWTYVYLPTEFKSMASVVNAVAGTYDTWFRQCFISADSYGVPYGLNNVPEGGWAAAKVEYNGGIETKECRPIPADEF